MHLKKRKKKQKTKKGTERKEPSMMKSLDWVALFGLNVTSYLCAFVNKSVRL